MQNHHGIKYYIFYYHNKRVFTCSNESLFWSESLWPTSNTQILKTWGQCTAHISDYFLVPHFPLMGHGKFTAIAKVAPPFTIKSHTIHRWMEYDIPYKKSFPKIEVPNFSVDN